jgi:hypothetical protein
MPFRGRAHGCDLGVQDPGVGAFDGVVPGIAVVPAARLVDGESWESRGRGLDGELPSPFPQPAKARRNTTQRIADALPVRVARCRRGASGRRAAHAASRLSMGLTLELKTGD